MATPSELLADSIAIFSKAAHQAFAEAESHAQIQVARATTDARDARVERDKATEALHAAQLEIQKWKLETASYQAALEQANLTIDHQTEIIAQLRRETTQWRDQSRNWQEHFLRVEQERCALSTRIEEVVSQNLQTMFVPYPSHHVESASAPGRASSSHHPPAYKSAPPISPSDDLTPSTTTTSVSTHQPSRSIPGPSKRPQASTVPSLTDLPPYQPPARSAQTPRKRKSRSPARTESRVIRRVQAVIHVKQEESDEDSGHSAETRLQDKPLQRARQRKKQPALVQDESEEDEPSGGEEEDEEDELMLVAKDKHYDIPSAKPSKPKKNIPPAESHTMAVPPNKKRKPSEAQKSSARKKT